MISIQLWGTPLCRRYQRMRTAVLESAAELGLEIELEEINETEQLSQSNPLDLPRLVANGELIASRNSPKTHVLTEKLRKVLIL
jgi:hypothetical protein